MRTYDSALRMPPMRPYLEDTFAHLRFAYEKARLDIQAANKNTWFGQLWNILNPLFLAMIYWLLVVVIFGSGGSIFDKEGLRILTQIVGGLFLFGLPSSGIALGARSIIQGGTFVLNTRLPRLILPVSAVISSFLVFLPSMLVYVGFHALARYQFGLQMLWIFPIILLVFITTMGLTMMAATGTVYFRDIASFLPYVLRIWMYLSPIIYLYTRIPSSLEWSIYANPLGALFTSWQQILYENSVPDLSYLMAGALWSFGSLTCGLLMFLRKEREFAVRI